MSLLFLTNTVGAAATSVSTAGASITGQEQKDAMFGPRNRLIRSDSDTSHSFIYTSGSEQVTHAVLARADIFKRSQNASQIKVEYDSGPTTDSTTAVGSMTLVGPKAQDWVKEIDQTSDNFRLTFEHSSAGATMYSKVYFSKEFTFGTRPQLVAVEKEERRVKPLLGCQWHQTEAIIQLRWEYVTQGAMAIFRDLPIYRPFFLYDEDGYLFDHKLEHVIIADKWIENRRVDGAYQLDMTLRRLKYYDA